MAGTTAEAQVAKRCYKNQTAGWLGVVKLDHLGAQAGHSIPPFGTAYLSDEEAILTARAPAEAKDNPFEEQMFMFVGEGGAHVEQAMRPLILLVDDSGEIKDERYVPVGGSIDPAKIVAEAARTDQALNAQSDRTVPTEPQEPTQVPGTPASAVDPAHAVPAIAARPAEQEVEEIEEVESWVENPDRTPTPQQGSLGGANGDAPAAPQGDAASPTGDGTLIRTSEATAPAQPPAPATVGSQHGAVKPSESAGTGEAAGAPSEQGQEWETTSPVGTLKTANPAGSPTLSETGAAEEFAAETANGEETGAADVPTGAPTEGEFAAHEEVGSPDAPSASPEDDS